MDVLIQERKYGQSTDSMYYHFHLVDTHTQINPPNRQREQPKKAKQKPQMIEPKIDLPDLNSGLFY